MTDRDVKDDNLLVLENGKPMIFGKDRDKGIQLNGLEPNVVSLNDVKEDDLLFHDESAESSLHALLLSRMRYPQFPVPIGVFRSVDQPKYDEDLNEQIREAVETKGPGDLEQLFHSGDTWVVGEDQ